MERLRIEYENGYMELNVEAFFPCVVQKARKVATLINRHCPAWEKEELLMELGSFAEGYGALSEMYKRKADGLAEDSPERRHWNARSRETGKLKERMENNIRIISGGRKDG